MLYFLNHLYLLNLTGGMIYVKHHKMSQQSPPIGAHIDLCDRQTVWSRSRSIYLSLMRSLRAAASELWYVISSLTSKHHLESCIHYVHTKREANKLVLLMSCALKYTRHDQVYSIAGLSFGLNVRC